MKSSGVKKLLIDVLETDADTQARVSLSRETIDEYVEAIGRGEELPPIDVFFDGSRYFIGDGWHRHGAWEKAGVANIPCFIHDGGEDDALLFAAGANQGHGRARTNADKRRAVEIVLRHHEAFEWSDVRIAQHCGVGDHLVAKVREQLAASESAQKRDDTTSRKTRLETRVGRDGKRRSVPKKPAPPPEEPVDTGPNIVALAAPYKRAANDLTRIKSDLKAIAKDEKVGAHLASKIVRIERDLDGVRGAITQSEPLQRCGKCEGEGCQHCARTGFWTRMTVESLKK